MSTVDRPRVFAGHGAGTLEFETLLAEISARFVNVPPIEVDREIQGALRRVCDFLEADLAVLWQWSSIPGLIAPTHVHPAPAQPLEPNLQDWYPWCVQEMLSGRTIVLSSLDALPPEAAVDRESARRSGIKSNLTLPLALGGEPAVGALALNSLRAERDWPDPLVKRLQVVAQVFASALARKRSEEALRTSEARLASGAALAGLAFYEVDFASGVMYVDDRLCEICGVPPSQRSGLQVLEFWLAHLHPDDRTRVLDERDRLHDGRLERLSSEYRYCHPAGRETWLQHVAGVAARDHTGRAVRTFGVFRDITERKRAEEALRESYAEIERLKDRLQAEADYLKAEARVTQARGELSGQSAAVLKVLRQIEQVAPTDSSVLVRGETGSGKELVAQAIHRLSPRRNNVMVKVNCAALPAGLVESELFGREKGAFTGALTRQVGRFEIADNSTLFLDEIGELSLDLQAKLLRVLEAGEFERLGSPRTIKVNVRLIAATNRDLTEAIKQGRFREDLYYRLNVFPIRVPPLRERPEDIPLLVWTFLEEFSQRMGKKITQVPRKTMEALQRQAWPGNVRELRNVIEHGAIVTTGETLRVPMLEETAPAAATSAPRTLADAEREHILRALDRAGGHVKGPRGAAADLGLKPATLYSRMKKLGIRPRAQTGDPSTR